MFISKILSEARSYEKQEREDIVRRFNSDELKKSQLDTSYELPLG